MEVQSMQSRETVEFVDKLNKLTELIKTAFIKRTPHLNGEKYLTSKDLSRLLHMSDRLLNTYRSTGKIGYVKISGKILYKESDVFKLLEESYVKPYGY